MSPTLPLEDRFAAKYQVMPNGCWLWTATLINSGYGRLWVEGRTELAHRVAYELYVGDIPDGMTIDHRCHNEDDDCPGGIDCLHRRCVNPDHLQVVTKQVNLLNGKTIVAANAVKTHCIRGHEYTPENTRIYTRLGREFRHCRECDRERSVERREREERKVRIRVRVSR